MKNIEGFGFYVIAKAILKKNKQKSYAPATTSAIGHRHAGALNSEGKTKVCERHQISEVIE